MKTPLLYAAVLGSTLSGCGIEQMVHDDDLKAARQKCIEYGFATGSNEFAQCMQRSVEGAEQQRDRDYYEMRRQDERQQKRK